MSGLNWSLSKVFSKSPIINEQYDYFPDNGKISVFVYQVIHWPLRRHWVVGMQVVCPSFTLFCWMKCSNHYSHWNEDYQLVPPLYKILQNGHGVYHLTLPAAKLISSVILMRVKQLNNIYPRTVPTKSLIPSTEPTNNWWMVVPWRECVTLD